MSLYENFWWVSQMAGRDTRRASRHFPEKNATPQGITTGVTPPEEFTTFNLVLRLAQRATLNRSQVFLYAHHRTLEGGTSKVVPSAADLDLVVEITPGNWLALALQAKRNFTDTNGNSKYGKWEKNRPKKLALWSTQHGYSPGLLLYNTDQRPFVGLDEPRSRRPVTPIFGGCCTPDKACDGSVQPPAQSPPTPWTPMAVSMVPDIHQVHKINVEVKNPTAALSLTPSDLQTEAAPLECMFCPMWRGRPYISNARPPRAAQIIEEGPGSRTAEEDDPDYSLVIQMSDEQRDAWRESELKE